MRVAADGPGSKMWVELACLDRRDLVKKIHRYLVRCGTPSYVCQFITPKKIEFDLSTTSPTKNGVINQLIREWYNDCMVYDSYNYMVYDNNRR
jgi:hypothetical protein